MSTVLLNLVPLHRVPIPMDGVWENPVLNQIILLTSTTCFSSVVSIDLVNNVSYCACVSDYFLERIPHNCSMQQPLIPHVGSLFVPLVQWASSESCGVIAAGNQNVFARLSKKVFLRGSRRHGEGLFEKMGAEV